MKRCGTRAQGHDRLRRATHEQRRGLGRSGGGSDAPPARETGWPAPSPRPQRGRESRISCEMLLVLGRLNRLPAPRQHSAFSESYWVITRFRPRLPTICCVGNALRGQGTAVSPMAAVRPGSGGRRVPLPASSTGGARLVPTLEVRHLPRPRLVHDRHPIAVRGVGGIDDLAGGVILDRVLPTRVCTGRSFPFSRPPATHRPPVRAERQRASWW